MVSLERIANICEGKLYGRGDCIPLSIVLDSRVVSRGDLFVCIKGQRTDGHLYLVDAFRKGAIGALVEKVPPGFPGSWNLIQVSSTPDALLKLARFWRDSFHPVVVAVTGTVGKTTTKEMVALMLSQSFTVLKSEGNLNTEFGVPLTIFKLNEKPQFLVLELGLQKPGDIERLTKVARPQVGIITQIGPAHLEYLGSVDNILKEKLRLIEHLPAGGIVVLNKDNKYLASIRPRENLNTVYYSLKEKAEIRGKILRQEENQTLLNVESQGKAFDFSLPFTGKAFIEDFLAAFSACFLLGVSPQAMSRALQNFKILPGRGEVKCLPNGVWLIDDSYNSNPTSLFASLENFVSLAKGRKIAVLGDMLELGKDAAFWHRKAGESLPQEINLFFLVGKLVREIARGAIRNGLDRSRIQCFESHDELNFYLKNSLKPGDWVLVKGSRGMGMERIIEEMEKMR